MSYLTFKQSTSQMQASGIVTVGSATRTPRQGSFQTDPLLQQLQLLQHVSLGIKQQRLPAPRNNLLIHHV